MIFKNKAIGFQPVLTFAVSILVIGAIIAGITTKFLPESSSAKTKIIKVSEPSKQIPCCTIENKKAYQNCVEELKPLADFCRAFLNGTCEEPIVCEKSCFSTYGSDMQTCPCQVTFLRVSFVI